MNGRAPGVKRVVILGGGHAGVAAAKQLRKKVRPSDRLEVAVVSEENAEIMHGFMPQVVSSLVQPSNALVSLRAQLPGVTIYHYRAEQIDLANRRIVVGRGDERDQVVLEYDYLVVALGSIMDLSRFPGLVEHGFQTKTMGDVFHLRNHIIEMLERASVEQDPVERQRMLTFVVAGAGYSGVEIACQANGLLRGALSQFPGLRAEEIRVILLSHSQRILPALSDGLAERAVRYMRRSGIDLRRGVGLAAATAGDVELTTGERIPTRTIVATVGVAPNPLVKELPVQFDRGRIVCDELCRVPGWPGVYAVGDAAAVPHPKTGQACPPTALYAWTQGPHAADNLLAEHRGKTPRPYRYDRIGELAFLSKGEAVATLKGIQLGGFVASMIGRIYVLTFLVPTWQRKVTLALDWITSALFPRDLSQLRVGRSDHIVPMRFAAGETIVRQGDPGSRFYIITEGEAEVVQRGEDGQERRLTTLGPGQYFGEIALLHDVRRTATVRALADTRVLGIARQDFRTLVEHMPMLRERMDRPPSAPAESVPTAE